MARPHKCDTCTHEVVTTTQYSTQLPLSMSMIIPFLLLLPRHVVRPSRHVQRWHGGVRLSFVNGNVMLMVTLALLLPETMSTDLLKHTARKDLMWHSSMHHRHSRPWHLPHADAGHHLFMFSGYFGGQPLDRLITITVPVPPLLVLLSFPPIVRHCNNTLFDTGNLQRGIVHERHLLFITFRSVAQMDSSITMEWDLGPRYHRKKRCTMIAKSKICTQSNATVLTVCSLQLDEYQNCRSCCKF